MTKFISAAAVALSIASFSVGTAFAAPATASSSWDAQHNEVRCDTGSDKCVVLQCAGVDFPCVVTSSFDRDKAGAWMTPYGFHAPRRARAGEQWSWYGKLDVSCDRDGQHCRELEY